MNVTSFGQTFVRITQLSALSAVLCFGLAAQAQPLSPQQTYEQALEHCETLTSEEARLNCRRDAGAAFQEARNNPDKYQHIDEQTLTENRRARCEALPADQRELCIKSLQDNPDTEVMGSVEGGGILRKTTITERGEPYTVPTNEAPVPTTNTEEPLKAKEAYGAHPIR